MKKTVKDKIKKIWRYPYMQRMKRLTKDCNVRILSSNCIGGLLYHDMGKSFDSPTINCTVFGMDFINLCKNPEKYLSQTPVQCGTSPQGYPIADVGGIKVNCVHYKDIEDFNNQWLRRSKRFLEKSDEDIVVISCNAQIRSQEEIEAFHALPYRKVCFTNNPDVPYEEFVYVPGYDGEKYVGDLTRYAGYTGARVFEKYFDFVKWLNNKA